MKFKKTTLKNGLRILTVPMQGTQTATVMLMVGVGSRFETEREAGLAHFVEHMLFKGAKKYSDARAISEALDSIGGEFNAFTSKEKTGYHAKVDAQHLDLALDVLCDIFLNSKFEEAEIKRERGSIIQELGMYEDRPSQKVWDVFDALLYGKNPLGRDIIGYRKNIKTFKRKDFLTFLQRYYVANETVLCVAGKFEEKKVLNKIKKYFADFKSGKKAVFVKIAEKQKEPASDVCFKKTDQTSVVVGHRAYDKNHPDRYALALLSVILGGNMSSRLFVEIREKRGLAYSVFTSVDTHHDCGYIATRAGVSHKNLTTVVKLILTECEKMKQELVTEKELKHAKEYFRGKTVMEMEASDEVAQFFCEQELVKGEVVPLQEFFVQLEKVTPQDIQRVAMDVFRGEKLNVAVVGPHKKSALNFFK